MLDRKDVDAVVVSTPDHWHALMTILACAAGKDVYVEKPLNHAVREGEWMLRAQRHNRRVVQVGTQQRSGEHYRKCVELLRDGRIGDLRNVRIAAARNITARLRKAGRTGAVGRGGLGHVAGAGALRPLRREPLPLPLPLVLGLLGRTDHEPPLARHRRRAVGDRGPAQPGRGHGRALLADGNRRDAGRRARRFFDYPGFIANWTSHEIHRRPQGGLEFHGTKGS